MCEHYKEAMTSWRVRIVATRRQETDCLSLHYRIIPFRNKPSKAAFTLATHMHFNPTSRRPSTLLTEIPPKVEADQC